MPSILSPFFHPTADFWMAVVIGAVALEAVAAVIFRLRLF
jgi:hypothetical protein